jgi:FixJ family two-component response regulator
MPPETVISIVDDDDAVRRGIKSLLQSLDYIVHTFASAEEFLKSPQLHQTSCLISDVRMPGVSGLELQARLHAEGHHISVIFVTAHPDGHLRDRAMRSGAIAFMSKPISEADLIRCLDRALKNND